MTETIIIGNNPDAKYIAFGDDSQYKNILTFAFAILKKEHLAEAISVLEYFRSHYKFPDDVPIHCRVLFSGAQREKHGLSHLDPNDIKEMISKIFYHSKKIPILCRYATSVLSDKELILDKDDDFPEIKNDPKGILGLLMQGCFAVPGNGQEGPTAKDTEIFVSSDKTKIKFFGDRKNQAEKLYSGFSDIDAPSDVVNRIQPNIIENKDWKQRPLIQLADVFSYVCSHADLKLQNSDYFTDLIKSISYVKKSMEL
ncbi:hypothetical protein ACQV5M_17450 [Leptospira sp. SA-E8]|uniref:hypothetical protein n=1 Tax=Leptospira sp. SA-E8 TaxID=3422259 RepID=UPI003EBB2100